MSSTNLCIRENFLSSEYCLEIIRVMEYILESYEPDGYTVIKDLPLRGEVSAGGLELVGEMKTYRLITEIRKRIVAEVSTFYNCPGIYPEYTLLTKMETGSDTVLHADSEKLEKGVWVPNHTPVRSHTGMLYLNNGSDDFSGGEIEFPNLGVKITPKAGLLVGFKTTHKYIHQVPAVLSGQRYSLSLWMTEDKLHKEDWA